MPDILNYLIEIKSEQAIIENKSAQLINGKWYILKYGCDTLQLFIDDINSYKG